MPVCRQCGGKSHRIHRSFRQQFRYSAVYRCRDCGDVRYEDQWYLFLFGSVSRCPNCGNYKVRKLRGVDKVDRMYKNPLSYWQKFFGANLHWCPNCRLQFYDLRPKRPLSVKDPGTRTETAAAGIKPGAASANEVSPTGGQPLRDTGPDLEPEA